MAQTWTRSSDDTLYRGDLELYFCRLGLHIRFREAKATPSFVAGPSPELFSQSIYPASTVYEIDCIAKPEEMGVDVTTQIG